MDSFKIFGILSFIIVLLGVLISRRTKDEKYFDKIENLPENLQIWFSRGKYVKIKEDLSVFVIDIHSEKNHSLIFIHGFPTSSYDYHRLLPFLESMDFRVVLYDLPGFGFSDKPSFFSYSLVEYADVSLSLWRTLNVTTGTIVAHDMGNSILTEILARKSRQLLPEYFDSFFSRVIFSNGGMSFERSNLRIGQMALLNPFLGPSIDGLFPYLPMEAFLHWQLASIWGLNTSTLKIDTEAIYINNCFKNGNRLMSKLIQYLRERQSLEFRWFSELPFLKMPIHVLWGNKDTVAPLSIAHYLLEKVLPSHSTLDILEDVGHFPMLESPEKYLLSLLHLCNDSLANV